MVLPPSKRQKAQKPHCCAVFLLLERNVFFCLKSNKYFSDLLSVRGPAGFFDSLKPRTKNVRGLLCCETSA